MRYRKIPDETIRRLPMYLRTFLLYQQKGKEYVSSRDMAEELALNPPQIRKDFSYFGALGVKGTGYHVDTLIGRIREILKLDNPPEAVLIGAGRLGKALALYPGFKMFGFMIVEIFDNAPKKIGKKIGKICVKDVSRLSKLSIDIKLAILAVPAHAAQETADVLIQTGIKGILNMAPCQLKVPKRIKVVTIDIAMELGTLPYYF